MTTADRVAAHPRCAATHHGTASDYTNRGCRCPQALAARRRQRKTRPLRIHYLNTDGTGTRRRLRALQAIGWPLQSIAEQLGYTDQGALTPILYRQKQIEIGTAQRIATLYDRLSMTPGPSRRVTAIARRRGWPPPLAWDGDTIDDPYAQPTGIRGRA